MCLKLRTEARRDRFGGYYVKVTNCDRGQTEQGFGGYEESDPL